MATDIVQGLFGMTPESYQLEQQAAAQKQAMQFAQMDPFQRAAYGTFLGGSQLGGAIGGALGAQDPMLQRISQQQSLLKEINPSDATSLAAGIQKASEMGNPQLAAALSNILLKLRETESVITRNERERKGLDPFEQLLRTAKYTTPSLAKYKKSGDPADLELLEKPAKAQIKEVGVAESTREPVYTYQATPDSEPKQVIYKTNAQGEQVMVPYSGGVDRTTSKVTATATSKASEAGLTELAKIDARMVGDAQKARESSIAAINSLNKLAVLPADQLISGQFATGRVGVTNLLTTLGLASPADASRLANSQQYQKVAGDVILQTLGGKLGSGFSNADREFIASLVPQLETNPEARRQLIMFMQEKNQNIIKEATRMEEHFRSNEGSLKGFKPTIPLSVTPSAPNPYSGLSNEELDARIRALQGKK